MTFEIECGFLAQIECDGLGYEMKFELDPNQFWIRIEGDGDDIERQRNTYKHKKLHKKVYGGHGWNLFGIVDFLPYMPDYFMSRTLTDQ